MNEWVPSSRGMNLAAAMNVYAEERGYVVAVRGPFIVQMVSQAITLAGVSATARALDETSRKHSRLGFITVLESTAQLMLPAEIRRGIDAYVKRYTDHFAGAAIVFEGGGFQATVVRSIVTAINIASSARHDNRVFTDVVPATEWLEMSLAIAKPHAGRLHDDLERLRKYFHRQTD